MTIQKLMNRVRNFAKDQGGMEALQTVCIVAIAATILIAAATFGGKGTKMMQDNFTKMDTEIKNIGKAESAPAAPGLDQLE